MGTHRVHILAVALVVPLIMGNQGGCASTSSPPVQVVADTFCQTAKKRTWHPDDTPESIEEAIKWNRGLDRACGVPGKSKPVS